MKVKVLSDEDAHQGVAPLDRHVGYNLRRATAVMLADFDTEFAGTQLRPTTYGMLATIEENPNISSAALGRRLGIKSANMAPLLAELEGRGLVTRNVNDDDRRAQALSLTPAAREAMTAWRCKAAAHEDRVLHRIPTKDRAVLLGLLRRIWDTDDE